MVATEETLNKINSLSEDNINIVISLIDQLSASQGEKKGVNPFRLAQKARKGADMTEDEVEELVSSIRKELNASGN